MYLRKNLKRITFIGVFLLITLVFLNVGIFSDQDMTYAATESITITSPNGGEQWEAGKTYDITWESTGVEKIDAGLLVYDSNYNFNGLLIKTIQLFQLTHIIK